MHRYTNINRLFPQNIKTVHEHGTIKCLTQWTDLCHYWGVIWLWEK